MRNAGLRPIKAAPNEVMRVNVKDFMLVTTRGHRLFISAAFNLDRALGAGRAN
jgi:hypothetical protein